MPQAAAAPLMDKPKRQVQDLMVWEMSAIVEAKKSTSFT
jgi:hypothetical protein